MIRRLFRSASGREVLIEFDPATGAMSICYRDFDFLSFGAPWTEIRNKDDEAKP